MNIVFDEAGCVKPKKPSKVQDEVNKLIKQGQEWQRKIDGVE